MPTVTADEISPAAAPAAPAAEPAAAPAAAPAAPAAEPAKGEAGDLPEALLKEVPALQLLMQGSPPATIAPKDAEYPELKVVAKHVKDLGAAGFGVYQTADKKNVVFFNGLLVTPDDLKAADEAGKLDQIAVPYADLRTALEGGAGEASGTAPAAEAAGAPNMAPAAAVAPAGAGAQPSPAVDARLNAARITNLNVGSPTSGPAPGSGRILNNILKPAI